jgi:hypothetical protein
MQLSLFAHVAVPAINADKVAAMRPTAGAGNCRRCHNRIGWAAAIALFV